MSRHHLVEVFSTPEKIFRRMADAHHLNLEASMDALAAAQAAEGEWIPVSKSGGLYSVQLKDGKWRITIKRVPHRRIE